MKPSKGISSWKSLWFQTAESSGASGGTWRGGQASRIVWCGRRRRRRLWSRTPALMTHSLTLHFQELMSSLQILGFAVQITSEGVYVIPFCYHNHQHWNTICKTHTHTHTKMKRTLERVWNRHIFHRQTDRQTGFCGWEQRAARGTREPRGHPAAAAARVQPHDPRKSLFWLLSLQLKIRWRTIRLGDFRWNRSAGEALDTVVFVRVFFLFVSVWKV